MRNVFFTLTLLFFSHFAFARINPEYYGAQNQEATFSFEASILIPTSLGPVTSDLVKREFKKFARYILGQMRHDPYSPAALYPKFETSIKKVENINKQFNRVLINFNGRGIFKPKLNDYTFYVPTFTDDLFIKSKRLCSEQIEEVEESNFWYHWSPEKQGCPLVENKDYTKIRANLSYLESSVLTYPEYKKLFRNGNEGGLRMSIFFGLSEHGATDWNPDTNTSDWGARGFKKEKKFLIKKLGFQSYIWNENEVRAWYNPPAGKPLPRVETLTKDTLHGKMTIRLFFGDTDLYHDSRAFHLFYKDALLNDSIIIYRGHSGIGANLDLAKIQAQSGLKMNLSPKYQIYFFGSCVPYAYYTDMYFQKKATSTDFFGTKNLDIITYGNESTFANVDDFRLTRSVLNFMENSVKTSYQDIISEKAKFYLGVNGDEDNPSN